MPPLHTQGNKSTPRSSSLHVSSPQAHQHLPHEALGCADRHQSTGQDVFSLPGPTR